MRQRITTVLFLYVGVITCASAQTSSTSTPIAAIIGGMTQARADNQAHFRSYIVTRDYKLFGKERAKTESQVIADISFVPPATKTYTIRKTSGTGFGETIVRRMLMSEVEIARNFASTDFSPDNYDFRFVLEENKAGQRCYALQLLPKRNDKNLLRGIIWVDTDTYLPQRIEGEPVKTPSWWLRSLRIELEYGEVGGMWLQTALEATATVRILGPHTIVSRDVKYQLNDLVENSLTTKALELQRASHLQAPEALPCWAEHWDGWWASGRWLDCSQHSLPYPPTNRKQDGIYRVMQAHAETPGGERWLARRVRFRPESSCARAACKGQWGRGIPPAVSRRGRPDL
jgi:hypothetical protein